MAKRKPLAVCITDTHLTEKNGVLVKDIFNQAFDVCDSIGVKTMVHKGDWFNNRAGQPLDCLMDMREILDEASKRNIRIYGIQGNHDKTDLSSPKGYMSVFKGHPALTLFEEYGSAYFGNVVFAFLPYFTEGVEYLSRLDKLIQEIKGFNGKKVLFTHASINGVRNNDGTFVDKDNEAGFFEVFDLVLVGHYHNYQEILDFIIYTGSAYQANFGEDIKKGFHVLYDDLSIEAIQSKFPLYRKLVIEATEVDYELIKEYKDSGDNLRFVFTGRQDDIDRIDANRFLSVGIDVKYDADERLVPFSDVKDAELTVFDKKSVAKSWLEYCKESEVEGDKKTKGLKMLTTNKIVI